LAARQGGKFVLVLDEDLFRIQRLDKAPGSLTLNEYEERFVEALVWLGCPPDFIGRSSETRDLMVECAAYLNIKEPQITEPGSNLGVLWRRIGRFGTETLQYVPWSVLSCVVEHRFFGVTGFVRGWDLVGEALLYDFLCCQLGWAAPEQWYIPVVRRGWTFFKESVTVGSPSAEFAPSILELKQAGVTGEEIIGTLRELDFRRDQESRDCINIPNDILQKPTRPGTIAFHLADAESPLAQDVCDQIRGRE
jgi:hypothetical protein